jgi:hypothetical protein
MTLKPFKYWKALAWKTILGLFYEFAGYYGWPAIDQLLKG